MILKKLTLRNFRQFYGEQDLVFATDEGKNVTLIHAENGVGKTAILNAILWCFYEKTTSHFLQPDKLLSHEAQRDRTKEFQVGVLFEHEGDEYSVVRGHDHAGRPYFRAHQIDSNGSYRPLTHPESFVNSVVPAEMANYFFFDGEHIGTITHQEIGEAIRNILGFSLAREAIRDLEKIKQDIDKDLAQQSKDAQVEDWQAQKERALTVGESLDEKKRQGESRLSVIERDLADIEAALRDAPLTSELQRQRDDYNALRRTEEARLSASYLELHRWLERYSIAVVGRELASEALLFINEGAVKGRIPSPYNEQFVQDLLEAQKCICGRELTSGSKEFAAVQSLLRTAATAVVNDRLQKARSSITECQLHSKDARDQLKLVQQRIAECQSKLARLEGSLREIGDKLRGVDEAEVAALEHKRDAALREQKQRQTELGSWNEKLDTNRRAIEDLTARIESAIRRQSHTRVLQKKSQFVASLIKDLQTILDRSEKAAKGALRKDLSGIIERVARRAYEIELDDDFRLALLKDGKVVAEGTGEKQLKSLAFISSLIRYAELRAKQKNEVLVAGAIAPFVIDSPFGHLDRTYRTSTSQFIPERARQVVFLLSSSQWNGVVEETLHPRVGSEYMLISENRASRGQRPADDLEIKGKLTQLSRWQCERDMTRIQGV